VTSTLSDSSSSTTVADVNPVPVESAMMPSTRRFFWAKTGRLNNSKSAYRQIFLMSQYLKLQGRRRKDKWFLEMTAS
jgi:hypothetical protein